MKKLFGVDIGGTTVKMGLFTETGDKLSSWEIPTRTEDSGKNILPDIAASIRGKMKEENLPEEQVAGIGIGAPGPFTDDGVVQVAVNLGWGEFNVREVMEKEAGLPVRCGNDANVAALGECWKGAGEGASEMLMVTLGTGVGGGIIHGGRIFNGNNGGAGEIGHIHIRDDEEDVCGCGNRGCFEQYASATGAVRIARRMLAAESDSCVLRGKDFECKDIFMAAADGDAMAKKIIAAYGDYLGRGLAMIATVLNPEVIVIGGGVSKSGDLLIDLLRPSFDRFVFKGCKNVRFEMAKLGNDAGIYGAARLVME